MPHTTVVNLACTGVNPMTPENYPPVSPTSDADGELRPYFVPTVALVSTVPVGVLAAATVGSLLAAALVALGTVACILLAGVMIRPP
ncbi:hypothetical protein ACFYVR_26710 [Rhodococcus sp. NPDC003318]|uniref:hypothetical protein n=1 Tax=Rhodococcus sp. NPDC003318 TaxID=3364503 RepID=UPI0036828E15